MIKSLIGQKFNYLEVIDGPIIKNKKTYWKCRCDCGKEKEIRSDGLKSGSTKSCGCYKNNVLIQSNIQRQTLDLTNQNFGKLTALYATEKRSTDGRVIWKCQCSCGNYIDVDTHALQQGKTSSCGCLKSKGELAIESLLKQNNISFIQQKTFDTCRFPDTLYNAYFDFYVDNKYLIEFDGEQHFYFKSNPHNWNTEENFKKTKEKDNYKNEWCKINNFPLIRIPYTHLNELSINDLLLATSQFIV